MLYILLILLVLLMFMAFFEDYISERDRLWLFIGAAAVMALVAGFRPDDVDKDYDNYIRYYYSFDITTEYTFILIANLIRFTIDNYIYVFAIYAAHIGHGHADDIAALDKAHLWLVIFERGV